MKNSAKRHIADDLVEAFRCLGARKLADRRIIEVIHMPGSTAFLVKLEPLPEDGQGDLPHYMTVKISFPM